MSTFRPNTTFLTAKFNEFNDTYFDGVLPMVTFIYNHSKKNLGMYSRDKNTIRITLGRPEMTEHDCEEILIHEMVHAWQNYWGYWSDGHRRSFLSKADEINRKSNHYFHIARCTNLENAVPRTIKRNTDYVQILVCRHLLEKTYYVGRVMDYHKFENWLGKYYYEIKCYECHGKAFANFVRSYRQFNYKTMSEERFEREIKKHLGKELPFDNQYRKAM